MKRISTIVPLAAAATFGAMTIQPTPVAAQSEIYALCRGKGTSYFYIVPRSMYSSAAGNLDSCNFFTHQTYSYDAAISEACFRIRNSSASQWPQTWNVPRDFGINISC